MGTVGTGPTVKNIFAAMLSEVLATLTTSEELQAAVRAIKERGIALLQTHFAQHPEPLTNSENVDDQLMHLNLLDYQVAVRKCDSVSVVEISEHGFIYEPDYGERGWESYAGLTVGAVLDLVGVVEQRRQEATPAPTGN